MKLYLVKIKGGINPCSVDYSEVYVVANSSEDAYKIYREFLDDKDLCFEHERCLESVTLLAEKDEYPECRKLLFL